MSSFSQNRFYMLIMVTLFMLTAVLVGCQGKTASPASPTLSATSVTTKGSTALRIVQAKEKAALEIWVDQVNNLYAVDLECTFDPTKLPVADADASKEGIQIQPGQAPTADFVVTNEVNMQTGIIRYVVTQVAPREGFNGQGLLATINLQVAPVGEPSISVKKIILVSREGQPIEVTVGK